MLGCWSNKVKISLLLFFSIISFGSKAQLYKAEFVSIQQYGQFEIVGRNAYLNYNVEEMYAELMFNDAIYKYEIKRVGKPKNNSRYVVRFRGSDDTMMWNTSVDGDYIFAFDINGETYWFRNLSHPLREEYDWVKLRLPVSK